jgi:putative ABC transport system permease protein
MFAYYLRLALQGLRRTPGLTTLMVCAIGLGIAACVMMLTVYHAKSGNPIWWKNDRLYTVTIDSWDPAKPYDIEHPSLPPPQLTYRDAMYLHASRIPERSLVMFKAMGVLSGGAAQRKPEPVVTRVTTADFFVMFDVPFLYGSGWSAAADTAPGPQIVISREENDKLFAGTNSVGRTIRWNDHDFRIVGVLDHWHPMPKFYDLNNGAFAAPEDVYIPFGWGEALQLVSAGNNESWQGQEFKSYRDFLNSETLWLQMWVELPNAAALEKMRALVDAYWAEQRKAGRFPRPRNNRITNVSGWLAANDVVSDDDQVLVGLAFAFLAVCLINTVGLLLAKFLNGAAIAGVRRALGASQREIFTQHLVEVGVLSAGGALLGLGLSTLGLWALRVLFDDREGIWGSSGLPQLIRVDVTSVVATVALAVVAALAAGLYPAWRAGRLPPAVYLKSQ